MTNEEAAKLLNDVAAMVSVGAALGGVEGLVAGGVSAALALVADIVAHGGDPVEHITRIRSGDEHIEAVRQEWLRRREDETGILGGAPP